MTVNYSTMTPQFQILYQKAAVSQPEARAIFIDKMAKLSTFDQDIHSFQCHIRKLTSDRSQQSECFLLFLQLICRHETSISSSVICENGIAKFWFNYASALEEPEHYWLFEHAVCHLFQTSHHQIDNVVGLFEAAPGGNHWLFVLASALQVFNVPSLRIYCLERCVNYDQNQPISLLIFAIALRQFVCTDLSQAEATILNRAWDPNSGNALTFLSDNSNMIDTHMGLYIFSRLVLSFMHFYSKNDIKSLTIARQFYSVFVKNLKQSDGSPEYIEMCQHLAEEYISLIICDNTYEDFNMKTQLNSIIPMCASSYQNIIDKRKFEVCINRFLEMQDPVTHQARYQFLEFRKETIQQLFVPQNFQLGLYIAHNFRIFSTYPNLLTNIFGNRDLADMTPLRCQAVITLEKDAATTKSFSEWLVRLYTKSPEYVSEDCPKAIDSLKDRKKYVVDDLLPQIPTAKDIPALIPLFNFLIDSLPERCDEPLYSQIICTLIPENDHEEIQAFLSAFTRSGAPCLPNTALEMTKRISKYACAYVSLEPTQSDAEIINQITDTIDKECTGQIYCKFYECWLLRDPAHAFKHLDNVKFAKKFLQKQRTTEIISDHVGSLFTVFSKVIHRIDPAFISRFFTLLNRIFPKDDAEKLKHKDPIRQAAKIISLSPGLQAPNELLMKIVALPFNADYLPEILEQLSGGVEIVQVVLAAYLDRLAQTPPVEKNHIEKTAKILTTKNDTESLINSMIDAAIRPITRPLVPLRTYHYLSVYFIDQIAKQAQKMQIRYTGEFLQLIWTLSTYSFEGDEDLRTICLQALTDIFCLQYVEIHPNPSPPSREKDFVQLFRNYFFVYHTEDQVLCSLDKRTTPKLGQAEKLMIHTILTYTDVPSVDILLKLSNFDQFEDLIAYGHRCPKVLLRALIQVKSDIRVSLMQKIEHNPRDILTVYLDEICHNHTLENYNLFEGFFDIHKYPNLSGLILAILTCWMAFPLKQVQQKICYKYKDFYQDVANQVSTLSCHQIEEFCSLLVHSDKIIQDIGNHSERISQDIGKMLLILTHKFSLFHPNDLWSQISSSFIEVVQRGDMSSRAFLADQMARCFVSELMNNFTADQKKVIFKLALDGEQPELISQSIGHQTDTTINDDEYKKQLCAALKIMDSNQRRICLLRLNSLKFIGKDYVSLPDLFIWCSELPELEAVALLQTDKYNSREMMFSSAAQVNGADFATEFVEGMTVDSINPVWLEWAGFVVDQFIDNRTNASQFYRKCLEVCVSVIQTPEHQCFQQAVALLQKIPTW